MIDESTHHKSPRLHASLSWSTCARHLLRSRALLSHRPSGSHNTTACRYRTRRSTQRLHRPRLWRDTWNHAHWTPLLLLLQLSLLLLLLGIHWVGTSEWYLLLLLLTWRSRGMCMALSVGSSIELAQVAFAGVSLFVPCH